MLFYSYSKSLRDQRLLRSSLQRKKSQMSQFYTAVLNRRALRAELRNVTSERRRSLVSRRTRLVDLIIGLDIPLTLPAVQSKVALDQCITHFGLLISVA